MPSWKEIKARIKSVRNTGKITRAMELISTVKMKKAQESVIKARPFALSASRVMQELAGDSSEQILASVPSATARLVVLIAADKGLCGGYNVNIFRTLAEYLRAHAGEEIHFVTVGKRGKDFVLRTGNKLVADFSSDVQLSETAGTKKLSRFILGAFKNGDYRAVDTIYSRYISAIAQKPLVREMLPITTGAIQEFLREYRIETDTRSIAYQIEPDRETILQSTLPLVMDLMWRESLLEARASEHAARMVAMKNAKDSANKRAWLFTLQYNKARQASITKEVSEIVSGVESMKDI